MAVERVDVRDVAVLVLGVVLATAAASCAPPPPAAIRSGPMPSQPPSPGVVRSVAFTLTMPRGWADMTANSHFVSAVRPDGNLLLVLEAPQPLPVVRGVNDVAGVIVVTEPRSPIAASDVDDYLRSVTSHGATGVTDLVPVQVGSSSATAVTYESAVNGTPVEIKDVMAGHTGAMYEIELITSQSSFPSQESVFDGLLSSGWSWVSGD